MRCHHSGDGALLSSAPIPRRPPEMCLLAAPRSYKWEQPAAAPSWGSTDTPTLAHTRLPQTTKLWHPRAQSVVAHSSPHTVTMCCLKGPGGVTKSILYLDKPRSHSTQVQDSLSLQLCRKDLLEASGDTRIKSNLASG